MRRSTPGWSRTVTERTWRETVTGAPPREPASAPSRRHLLARLGGRRLRLLVADDHLVHAGARRDHRPHLLGLVDEEVQQHGLALGQGGGDHAPGVLAVEDVVTLDAVGLRELREVGVR